MGSSKIILLVWYLDCGEIWRNELCCFAKGKVVEQWMWSHEGGRTGYDVAFSILVDVLSWDGAI